MAGNHDGQARPFWRRPGYLIAAAVILVLVAAGIFVAVQPADDNDSADPPTPSTPARTPSAQTSTNPASSVCGLAAGPQHVPTTPPPHTRWELVGWMAAPTAPKKFGPGRTTDGGFRSCFAHSPTGALFAAVNYWALGWNGHNRRALKDLSVPSPIQRQALRDLKHGATPGKDTRLQVAGYRFLTVRHNAVTVQLALRRSDGQLVMIPTPLRWMKGDWKFRVSPTGDAGVRAIDNLTGYTPWSGT